MYEKIIKALDIRLNHIGKKTTNDENGNSIVVDSRLFTEEQFIDAIEASIATAGLFLAGPDNVRNNLDFYQDIVTHGALLTILSGHALLERGRECKIVDNGVVLDPPDISNILMEQWYKEYDVYMEKLRMLTTYVSTAAITANTSVTV